MGKSLDKEIISLISDLIVRPSFEQEEAAALYLAEYLKSIGCTVTLDYVKPHRPNIIAELQGDEEGKTLMFSGHLDTVPPASSDQLQPKVQDNCLYGRGSCDMKGALAAMSLAIKSLSERRRDLKGKVLFVVTMGEETGLQGMRHFIGSKYFQKADYCVVGEPTSLRIGIAHKGLAILRLETYGTAAHGSTPEEGINAIYHMILIIQALLDHFRRQNTEHPLLGTPTLNVGVIRGGERANVVPDHCIVEIDRRYLPTETIDQVVHQVESIIQRVKSATPKLEYHLAVLTHYEPFEIQASGKIVQLVRESYSSYVGTDPELVGLPYGTDGALTQAAGIPTVIFGPGNLTEAHSKGEFVSIPQLIQSYEIYLSLGQRILGIT